MKERGGGGILRSASLVAPLTNVASRVQATAYGIDPTGPKRVTPTNTPNVTKIHTICKAEVDFFQADLLAFQGNQAAPTQFGANG
jgi:hypothetical protein